MANVKLKLTTKFRRFSLFILYPVWFVQIRLGIEDLWIPTWCVKIKVETIGEKANG